MKNNLKRSLGKGDVTYGVWNGIVNGYVGELCARSGFDWMVIDAEHGPFGLAQIQAQLQAASGYETSVGLRVPGQNTDFIKSVLDLGAQSLVVPMIETAQQAREMVRAIHYPPEGIRGVGASMSRASNWGADKDYLEKASDELCLILQVESSTGLDQLEEILEVDGVDCIFIGPSDLATSMGFKGNFKHPEVEIRILDALQRIRESGKAAGILALEEELVRKYRDNGANMIGVVVDIMALAVRLRETAGHYKGQ